MTYLGCSSLAGLDEVEGWMIGLWPAVRQVADFGIGKGRMGDVARRTLPLARLVGCDTYRPAVEYCRERGYDATYKLSLQAFAEHDEARQAQLWLFGDVLEHVVREEALEALSKTPDWALLRIPVGPFPQGQWADNPHEAHLWSFVPSDLKEVPELRVVQIVVVPYGKKIATLPTFRDAGDHAEYETVKGYIGNVLARRRS